MTTPSFQAMTEPFLHPVSGEMFSATAYPLNILPSKKKWQKASM